MNEIFKISLIRSLLRYFGSNFPTVIILKDWDLVQEWPSHWFVHLIMRLKCRNLDSNFKALFAEKKIMGWSSLDFLIYQFCSACIIWFLSLAAELQREKARNCWILAHLNFIQILTEPIPLPSFFNLSFNCFSNKIFKRVVAMDIWLSFLLSFQSHISFFLKFHPIPHPIIILPFYLKRFRALSFLPQLVSLWSLQF